MKVKNIARLSNSETQKAVSEGARFVIFTFTISLIVVTYKKKSKLHFIRAHESRLKKGLPYSIFTALFGWWGIPNGPIQTLKSIANNNRGGKDVTDEVMATVSGFALYKEAEKTRRTKCEGNYN